MATYAYVVADSEGDTKKGNVTADSMAAAIEQLQSQGNTVIDVKESVLNVGESNGGGMFAKKPKTKELAVFCRQFVSIAEAGVPVISCLNMLAEQTENDMLRNAIVDCRNQIGEGETFSAAMEMHPRVFPMMLVTLAKAGEASGSLETSFTRMAEQFEKEAYLAAQIKKAGVYPAVVFVVAMIVVVVMLVWIVPTFEEMFADMGTKLPWITIQVVNASQYLQDKWYIVLFWAISIFLAWIKFLKSPAGQSFTSVMTLKIPVVNNLIAKTACARMSRTMSTLLGSGLGIMEALEITSETMSNLLYRRALSGVGQEVALGSLMNTALHDAGIFPPLVYHMVSIGEETGNTEKMLDTLAGYYEEEVEAATEAMMALLEPLTIIFLAVVVGGIIGAVMAPMASMYEQLGNL